jgi:hypothetical protein
MTPPICLIPAHPSSGTRMLGGFLGRCPSIKWFFESVDDYDDFFYKNEEKAKSEGRCFCFDVKYHQMYPSVLRYIEKRKPLIIHLIRFNIFETACSEIKRKHERRITLQSPGDVLRKQIQVLHSIHTWSNLLCDLYWEDTYKYMILPYESITRNKSISKFPIRMAKIICDFLGIDVPGNLTCGEKMIHPNGFEDKISFIF